MYYKVNRIYISDDVIGMSMNEGIYMGLCMVVLVSSNRKKVHIQPTHTTPTTITTILSFNIIYILVHRTVCKMALVYCCYS